MAIVTQTIAEFPGGSVALSWDDVTLVYSRVTWVVTVGTLRMTLSQSGKQTFDSGPLTTSGQSGDISAFGVTAGKAGKVQTANGSTLSISWGPS